MHFTMNEYFRVIGIDNWHKKLQSVAWFLRATYHSAIGAPPGQVLFGKDMIMPEMQNPVLQNKRVQKQKYDLTRENKNRIDHVYKVGDLVIIKNEQRSKKFDRAWYGPYEVKKSI